MQIKNDIGFSKPCLLLVLAALAIASAVIILSDSKPDHIGPVVIPEGEYETIVIGTTIGGYEFDLKSITEHFLREKEGIRLSPQWCRRWGSTSLRHQGSNPSPCPVSLQDRILWRWSPRI